MRQFEADNYNRFASHPEASGYVSDVVGEMFSIGAFAMLCSRVIRSTLYGDYIVTKDAERIKSVATEVNREVSEHWRKVERV